MSSEDLQRTIEAAWEARDGVNASTKGAVREAVETALGMLDSGKSRVAEKVDGNWIVHQWLKKAVLLSFRLNPMEAISGGPGGAHWWDKVPSKFAGWGEDRFRAAGFRAVPGAIVRYSAYIAPDVVLMPSFVNVGARVESGTMIDTWATVASCAQIGRNCHISGGAGIGGVLEPLQATPVVIEAVALGAGGLPIARATVGKVDAANATKAELTLTVPFDQESASGFTLLVRYVAVADVEDLHFTIHNVMVVDP